MIIFYIPVQSAHLSHTQRERERERERERVSKSKCPLTANAFGQAVLSNEIPYHFLIRRLKNRSMLICRF